MNTSVSDMFSLIKWELVIIIFIMIMMAVKMTVVFCVLEMLAMVMMMVTVILVLVVMLILIVMLMAIVRVPGILLLPHVSGPTNEQRPSWSQNFHFMIFGLLTSLSTPIIYQGRGPQNCYFRN